MQEDVEVEILVAIEAELLETESEVMLAVEGT